MSSIEFRFLEPLDVLFLRGNKLFGDPGSFGESVIPPWPSVAAGALRSRMLADDGVDPAAFARGEISHPALGTPKEPGPFTVTTFTLGRRLIDGTVEPLFAPPADLVLSRDDGGGIQVRALTPTAFPTRGKQPSPQAPHPGGEGRILSSAPLPLLPVLAEAERSKPVTGYWLTTAGWGKYLKGEVLSAGDFVPSSDLWAIDPRVGVGLDAATRRAADGRLFSVQAVAFHQNVGFVAGVAGADLPKDGMLRFGGDGRGVAVQSVAVTLPKADYEAIVAARRCRLVLTTPGIFPAGWLSAGMSQTADGGIRFHLHGVKGRLVCAAVPRAEVVSGWDLAQWAPKLAQRAAPTGSVYWLDDLEVTPEALGKLVESGLWPGSKENAGRRAEGFNRIALSEWR